MRQYVQGTVLFTLTVLFTVASWIILQTRLAYASETSTVLALLGVACGYRLYAKALRLLYHKKITVQLFVVIAIAASITAGYYIAAATVVLIILAGTSLEDYVLHRTRGAIEKLVNMSPKTALVRRKGVEVEAPVEEIQLGETVLVKPGEKIPIDGTVISGYSAVNQAAITGESMPAEKARGNYVFAGSMNGNGALEVRTEKIAEDTTLAHIIHLVEEAQEKRAPIQNVADRFTTYFVPSISTLAILVFTATYLLVGLQQAITRTVAILLVACPCALSLAVPIALVGAIGNASMNGIIIKGGTNIEKVKDVKSVAIDKTGTLTIGEPKVVNVRTLSNHSEEEIVRYAAIAEKFSEHPISKAVVAKAMELGMSIPDPTEFKTVPGRGVEARYGEQLILIGQGMMDTATAKEEDQAIGEFESEGKTVLPVMIDRHVVGLIAVADTIRGNSRDAIERLRQLGIRTVMITGDNMRAAKSIAGQIGVDEFQAELLPEQKAEVIGKMKSGSVVAMVGDGVNDAPALASADVGFAMGAAGSDVAIETADVALLGDDLTKVEYTIKLSRKAFSKMRMNIGFSIAWNVLGLTLASLGLLVPILAAVLQEAGCISVVINSSLLLLYKQTSG
ncbi:MAG: heavy metal translocating P-type ATPase [Candidatus Bathyarchaeia archaeon]